MFQDVAGVDGFARFVWQRNSFHYISIFDIPRKPLLVLAVKTSNQGQTLEAQRWRHIKVLPPRRSIQATAVLHAVTSRAHPTNRSFLFALCSLTSSHSELTPQDRRLNPACESSPVPDKVPTRLG